MNLSRSPNQNATSNDRDKGNAQLWRVKKIIMGISYRNLTAQFNPAIFTIFTDLLKPIFKKSF